MVRAIVKLFGAMVLAVAALFGVFLYGMRTKSPPVLNTVRRISRATKPTVLKSAGTAGSPTSVVRHVGRVSGKEYDTPITAVPTDSGFVIALPYGPNTDWLKNVLASGAATIVIDGETVAVDRPQVVSRETGERDLPAGAARALRIFGVDECLRLRRTEDAPA
jgi:deazaflavin-dependent oxidoreductase (nitroreductase family)